MRTNTTVKCRNLLPPSVQGFHPILLRDGTDIRKFCLIFDSTQNGLFHWILHCWYGVDQRGNISFWQRSLSYWSLQFMILYTTMKLSGARKKIKKIWYFMWFKCTYIGTFCLIFPFFLFEVIYNVLKCEYISSWIADYVTSQVNDSKKSQNRNKNFRTRTHLKLGQSTKISNNGKFGKGVQNNERKK